MKILLFLLVFVFPLGIICGVEAPTVKQSLEVGMIGNIFMGDLKKYYQTTDALGSRAGYQNFWGPAYGIEVALSFFEAQTKKTSNHNFLVSPSILIKPIWERDFLKFKIGGDAVYWRQRESYLSTLTTQSGLFFGRFLGMEITRDINKIGFVKFLVELRGLGFDYRPQYWTFGASYGFTL